MNGNVNVSDALAFVKRHYTPEVLLNLTEKLTGRDEAGLGEFTAMLNYEFLRCQNPQPSPAVVPFTSHNADDTSLTPEMEKILLDLKGS